MEIRSLPARVIVIDGRSYRIHVSEQVNRSVDAPRLVVVSRLVNGAARELLEVCLHCILHFTPEPHELWIVDNNSPEENLGWLLREPDVNLALIRTDPIPPEARTNDPHTGSAVSQEVWGSYANALALEAAVRLIDPATRYLMSFHMDSVPVRVGWLSFLRAKIDGRVGAAGVRMDRARVAEGVLHVLGYMVDFRLFRGLGLDFFPALPGLDVGDKVTVRLREAGYDVLACRNTLWEPQLVESIAPSSPFRTMHVDRAFDDAGNVIFLHLGRGVRKSTGEHTKGTTPEEWVRVLRGLLAGR